MLLRKQRPFTMVSRCFFSKSQLTAAFPSACMATMCWSSWSLCWHAVQVCVCVHVRGRACATAAHPPSGALDTKWNALPLFMGTTCHGIVDFPFLLTQRGVALLRCRDVHIPDFFCRGAGLLLLLLRKHFLPIGQRN